LQAQQVAMHQLRQLKIGVVAHQCLGPGQRRALLAWPIRR
jgi:hypothetical protein